MTNLSEETTHRNPTHFVAVFGLIKNDAGDVLMIRSPHRGWELPGGQVEAGEDLIQALQREVMEETGVQVEVGRLVGVYSRIDNPTIVLFGFHGKYLSGDLTPSIESELVEWVPPDQVVDRVRHDAIRGRIMDALSFNGRVIYRSYSIDPYQVYGETYF